MTNVYIYICIYIRKVTHPSLGALPASLVPHVTRCGTRTLILLSLEDIAAPGQLLGFVAPHEATLVEH